MKENPELGPFGQVRGFLLLSRGKVPINARTRCCFLSGRDETAHLSVDRAVGALLCFWREQSPALSGVAKRPHHAHAVNRTHGGAIHVNGV